MRQPLKIWKIAIEDGLRIKLFGVTVYESAASNL